MDKHSPQAELERFCCDQQPRLVALLSLYCGRGEVAHELSQEALARACRDWSKVRRHDEPAAWLTRVALNLANSYFRRRSAENRAMSRINTTVTDEPSLADAIVLREALQRLPRRQRIVLVLRFLEDLSVKETADLLQLPEGTVKTLTYRGVRALREEPALSHDSQEEGLDLGTA